jgi:hypothetical protein
MQHLARVGARAEQRVVAVHFADERVHVDHESLLARPGARPPGPLDRPSQHAVELARMAEGERTEKRSDGRRCDDAVAEHGGGAPGAQDVAVVDQVGAERHRGDQRRHLGARVRRTRTLTQLPVLHRGLDRLSSLRFRRPKRAVARQVHKLLERYDGSPVELARVA